ncbi:aryl-sulfate sulfotransferase [Campylobacter sp. RM12327]|uniref:aryl-sulfate sulfotransferase n=1 Tax=Campylobacter sputorum TaxID=206 RepID=UPI00187AECDB|nr:MULTISPECIES: aryl-sulfate sulfotransferase [Campylobacter]ASM39698.1 arylsulfate sulfotransferase [Campylobacter sputorum]MBE7358102.1 aryl-sulfate sulfotransferase [Campylobacter sp. RM11302]MBF6668914.1 aryl-sulfate sulfotransferase [Campylobacter sp. RM12327]MBF6673828.1 aryl-sulfate sulfotransferase [Campylobacter sp. RM13538]MBF6676268.1 aryl-sulfate sulfotransferase [Campylobacter sp. RM12321]
MKSFRKTLSSALVAAMLLSVGSTSVFAMGGPSGAKIDWQVQGEIGAVKINPYGYSPLTAVIQNGGYVLKDASVEIVPKDGGRKISYKIDDNKLKLYGGIPVWGLYADHMNEVKVKYSKKIPGKQEWQNVSEQYKIPTAPVMLPTSGLLGHTKVPVGSIKVEKVEKGFEDRLYLVNNVTGKSPANSSQIVWNNPAGGAMEWNYGSNAFIIDTAGDVRWYFDSSKLISFTDFMHTGIMMGFQQGKDGALTWGYGQRYVKYDLMGREVFNRALPLGYIDFSHSFDQAQNGNYLLRVASANTKRPDGNNVRTVRDVIVEVSPNGEVVDDWRLFEILDPYRSDAILVLDQGAVCLNIDASAAGHTMSEEELAKLDSEGAFGDIAGTGTGRNWVHVNSVDYDSNDDSIVISSRHQNAVIKIGRDKEVKWIIGAHKGWKDKFKDKLLQPVDSKGNKIVCENDYSKCPGYENEKGGFDWTWTQHTAFIIDSKTNKNVVYLTVFDNGDSRGMEQPALASMKYSRAVVYKVDQKKMTVEQVWEYGKQRGNSWYSPVTSLTKYMDDKNSIMVYSATAGMGYDLAAGKVLGVATPEIDEFKWGSKEPSVMIKFTGVGNGYQAMPISIDKAFAPKK